MNIKKFETIWFDFRIASYTYFKKKNLFILNKYLTYYRQLDNSASKKYKKFSRSWWFRRKQAHDFIYYLQKKFKIKTIFSIDKIITHLFNVVIK